MAVEVVNKRDVGFLTSEHVYIGRSKIKGRGRWGNPFVLSPYESRGATIERYRQYLWGEIQAGRVTLEDLAALDGKKLVCFCKPHPCHGDVLAGAVAWAVEQLQDQGGQS